MKRFSLFIFLLLFYCTLFAQEILTPDKIYDGLFKDVQLSHVFSDSKVFVDCIPLRNPAAINHDYKLMKISGSDLKKFIETNFSLPVSNTINFKTGINESIIIHINRLWRVLTHNHDSAIAGSSLLALPYPYIIPGGRFREIYYWDSYFTMLGLKENKDTVMIENMIKNFAYLIEKFGHIPNGNRTYYLSRSQPPFFSLMIDLLASMKGEAVYIKYLPALQKEYDYFTDKTENTKHIVIPYPHDTLQRYYDQDTIPRQESYLNDYELAKTSKRNKGEFYRDIRSGAESGWDFSSRWFADGKNMSTICVTDYIPVDLNCLLFHLEQTLSKAYEINNDLIKSSYYNALAEKRKNLINKYCWSKKDQWFVDYNFKTGKRSSQLTLAGMVPFFLQIADTGKARSATKVLAGKFLKPGGLVTSLQNTGQQWDAPNGWAPLIWMSVTGLENYGQQKLAKEIATRWINLNHNVYKRTGKLMEKYNVVNINLKAGGGEYVSQDGFGWTNGVFISLVNKYHLCKSDCH